MSDAFDGAWMETVIRAARPRALAALLRIFRNLDAAEEAFQDACLKALEKWPVQGPPRDAAGWLIMVARNAGIDVARRRARERPLPDDDDLHVATSDPDVATRRGDAHYRDDILRLLFVCCHPDLPNTQQIALALRLVCGLRVPQIARAFLVSESAMEQRITRGKQRVAQAKLPFDAPDPNERSERLGAVAAVLYLMFNEGYSAHGQDAEAKRMLCDEAVRLTRLVLRLFPEDPGVMGLLSLMLLQHARTGARWDEEGRIVLLEDQDRARWDGAMIGEGVALLDKALRHRSPDPYQVQAAIAALHARARTPADTDWEQIERLYATLGRLSPSPVVTLNRAVAVAKVRGPAEALALIEPLLPQLENYFYFFGLMGALLRDLGRTAEAKSAFDRAIALASSTAEAAHIRMQLDRLEHE